MDDGIWTQVFRIEQQVLLSIEPSLPATRISFINLPLELSISYLNIFLLY